MQYHKGIQVQPPDIYKADRYMNACSELFIGLAALSHGASASQTGYDSSAQHCIVQCGL